ncbi:hypothetical protein SH661x_001788 [Planctomicrobium sp. SH661]|uniref:hypothetical protein n=1 Tax=Planctomicrobium sp. SH661 TaxID=3448124 RepID=UPI003F5AE9DB
MNTETATILRGVNGKVLAVVEDPEDARLFAAASALQDALIDLRKAAESFDAEHPTIQKADLALDMAGPRRNPGVS